MKGVGVVFTLDYRPSLDCLENLEGLTLRAALALLQPLMQPCGIPVVSRRYFLSQRPDVVCFLQRWTCG